MSGVNAHGSNRPVLVPHVVMIYGHTAMLMGNDKHGARKPLG